MKKVRNWSEDKLKESKRNYFKINYGFDVNKSDEPQSYIIQKNVLEDTINMFYQTNTNYEVPETELGIHSYERNIQSDKYLVLTNDLSLKPDFSIKLPSDLVAKIGLKIGDDVTVSILDEKNAELVVSKKFKGEEAKQKFRSLRDSLYDDA